MKRVILIFPTMNLVKDTSSSYKISEKLEEKNFKGAVRLASSDNVLAPLKVT